MPLDLQRLRSKFTDQQIVDNFGSQLGVDVAKLRAQYDDTVIAENLASQYDSLASKKVAPEDNRGAGPEVKPVSLADTLSMQQMQDDAAGAPDSTNRQILKDKGFAAASADARSGMPERKKADKAGFDKANAEAKKGEGYTERSRKEVVSDAAIAGKQGLLNVMGGGSWLLDKIPGIDTDGFTAAMLEQSQLDEKNKSAETQASNRRVQRADGAAETVDALLDDPMAIADMVFQSAPIVLPGMAAGALTARVAARSAASRALAAGASKEAALKAAQAAAVAGASIGGKAGEAVISGGMSGAQTEADIKSMPLDQLEEVSARFRALSLQMTPEEAREQLAAEVSLATAAATGGATALGGWAAGRVNKLAKLGDTYSDALLKRVTAMQVGKNVAGEVVEEGIQSPGEQIAGNLTNVDDNKGAFDEVGKATVMGVAGAIGQSGATQAGGALLRTGGAMPEAPENPAAGGLTPAPAAPSPQAGPVPSAEVLQASADAAAQKSREFATLADEARAMGNAELASQYETESQAAAAAAKQALDTLQAEHTGLQGIVNRTGITPPALIPEEAPRTVDGELLPADGGSPLSLPSVAQAQGQLPRPDEQVMVADSQGNVAAMGINSVNAMRQGAEQAQRDAVIDRGDLIVPSDAVPAAGKSKPRPVNPAAAGLSAARIPDSGNKVAATEPVLSGSEIQAESAPAVEATGEQASPAKVNLSILTREERDKAIARADQEGATPSEVSALREKYLTQAAKRKAKAEEKAVAQGQDEAARMAALPRNLQTYAETLGLDLVEAFHGSGKDDWTEVRVPAGAPGSGMLRQMASGSTGEPGSDMRLRLPFEMPDTAAERLGIEVLDGSDNYGRYGGQKAEQPSVASPFYIKHPQTGEDVPVNSIEDADRKFKALIASTGADFEGGMDVFDAATNQPVANLKASGKPTKVENADESRARSAEAIGKMATAERVDAKPTGEQEMRKRMAYLRGAIAASSDDKFKASAKAELRELTNKINSLKNADPAAVSPETVPAQDNADTSPLVPRDKRDDPETPAETENQKSLRIASMQANAQMAPSEREAKTAKARALTGARNAGMTSEEIADIEEIASQQSNSMEEFWAVGARLLNEEVAKRNPLAQSDERAKNEPKNEPKAAAADAASGPEQAIRDAFNATPVTIGAWKPITVSANGRTQQFLAMQKSINSQGRSASPIYLVNIKMGRMIAGAEKQPIAQVYRLSGNNNLSEEGVASPASAEQIKAWNDAGFDGLTAAAAPKTGSSPTGLLYPNRKLGFEVARIEDGGEPSSWANIALANLQPGDVVKVGNDSLTVKSIGAKAVTFTKADGKTTRFDVDTPRMEKLVRDVADLLGASHHSSHGRDWVSVLSRDPTFGRTAGVINLQDRGTEATASVDAMNLAARHARLDRAIDQLSDTEVHALYRKMGLAGELLNVDKKREALKQEHPDDTEAAMKARPEAAKPEVSDNTVFTEDAAEKAREVLRQALRGTQLNTGLDPKVLQAALTLSGYHVERGARTFAAYSQAMIKDLGDEVRPYLKSFYMALKYDPKAASIAEGMSSEAEVNAEPRTEDRRQSDEAVANDRRRGPRRVDDMTPEEMRQALLINPLTDLPNKRAFEEDADLGWPHVAAMDIDGFGFLNDIWGHDPVDAILKQIGGMMSEFSTDAVRLYHRSGDEFAARSNDKEALQLVLKSLQDLLKASTFTVDAIGSGGEPLTLIKHGIGVTYGISTDYQRADNEANADKERRLASGDRSAKGSNPGGMVEVDAQGNESSLGDRGLSRQETERLRNRGSERGLDPEQEAANRQEDIRQQRSQRMKAMLAERAKLNPTDELLTAVAKLGGLSKADAESQGIDPAYFSEQRAGIKFVFRPSGKSFDAMAEALDAEGYPVQDDQGRYSANTLLDLVTRSLSGSPVYTTAGYDAMMAAEDVQRALDEGDTAALPPSEISGYSQEESVVIVSFNDVINSGYDWTTVYRMIGDNDTEAEIHRLFAGLIAGDQEYVERYHTEAANLAGASGVPSQAEEAENEDIPGFGEGQAADDLTDDELTRHLNGETLESIRASRLADDFSLSTQTEEDLREKEAREQDADSAEEADRQRQIDATADNFTLSTGTGTAGEQVRPAVRGGARDMFASPAAEPSEMDDKDHFSVKRMNDDRTEIFTTTFSRDEYVKALISSKDSREGERFVTGRINGISHARREAKVNEVWFGFGSIYKTEQPSDVKPDTVPLSSVIDSLNARHGAGLTEADRVPDYSSILSAEADLWSRITDGTATVDEFKAGFERWVTGKEAIKAVLSKQTKKELLEMAGGMLAYRLKNEAKPAIVEAVWRDGMAAYALGSSITYGMGKDSYTNAVRRLVEGTDADALNQFADERKAAAEEAVAERAAAVEAVKDPKTLDDFIMWMRARMSSTGDSFTEARMALTPEQRVTFDKLSAESTRDAREARKHALKTTVRTAGQSVGGDIIATKHTRDNYDLFVVQLAERLSADDYKTVLDSAKKLGGWYSAYRGNGATPGFQFKEKASAEAFLKLAAGDSADAQAQAKQRRDSFNDDRSQTAVERLTEMADRLDQRADESLSAERKQNTARRARFAASAEAAANADKALAKTMRNIATAISEGKAELLDAVRQKVQVEMLTGMVRTAKDKEIRAKFPAYADQEKQRGSKPTSETADFAEFPSFTSFRSDLASLARQLLEVDGTKKIGQRLMKVADDVSDAYLEFAKANLSKVATFSIAGGTASLPSKDAAEKAISRSGLVGKAIVVPIKRGENLIVLSPSEAINRGVWTGDGDKRITLTRDFGHELVQAIGRRANKANRLTVPWQLETAADRLKALAGIGIETPAELRAALREFIALQEQPAAPNKIKEMERAMIGRLNDGLDFFPTPQEVADQMIEAAGIEPGMSVLEPSAGMGHIAERIQAAGVDPDVVELSGDRRELLEAKGFRLVGNDFLSIKPREFFTFGDTFRAPDGTEGVMRGLGGLGSNRVRLEEDGGRVTYHDRDDLTGTRKNGANSGYDRIIMNPPFGDRRDAAHVRHAYSLLKPGGRLVAIMGEGVFFGSDKKAQEFRDWLEQAGGTDEKLADNTFMDPSLPVNTGVSARMVVIDKPASGDMLYSRGSSGSGDVVRVERLIAPILAKWKNAPRIVIVQAASDLPGGAAPHDVEGAYSGNGVVYLVADNLPTEERIMEVLAHEAVGHAAMEAMLGADLMAELTKEIGAWERRGSKLFVELGQAVDASQPNIKDQPTRRAKEIVALMAERGLHKQGSLWKKVTEAIKAWLRGQGFSGKWVASLPEDMVFQMLRDAERYLKNGNGGPGGPRGSRKNVQASLAYSRRGNFGSDRTAWPEDFPRVVFAAQLGAAQKHADYEAAKAGDTKAAVRLVGELVPDSKIEAIREALGGREPIIVPVAAEEAAGNNKIPLAYAEYLASRLELETEPGIVQSARARRTGKGSDYRLGVQSAFDGKVRAGQQYLIVDDTMTMGGTLANLRGHIEANGGEVILASALTGFGESGVLALTKAMRDAVWQKHGKALDDYLKVELGYGIDQLTQGEAGHFRKAVSLDAIRDRIAAARNAAGLGRNEDALPSGEVTPGKPLFSRASPSVVGDTYKLPPVRTWITRLFDRFDRIKQVQKAVKEQGGQIDLLSDVYGQEEAYHSRAASAIDRFRRHRMGAIFKRMARAGVSLEDVGLYLYAQHAAERNAQIASINPGMPDGGSGMTNKEAADLLADFRQKGNANKLDTFARELRDITADTRQILRASGLESEDAIDAWEKAYQFYVPLSGKDEANNANTVIVGRGFDVRGGQKRAMGRKDKAKHIIEQIIVQHEQAVIRAEKNAVGKRLLQFVKNNPDDKLWEVNPTDQRRYIAADGQVDYRNQPMRTDRNVVAVRINGQDTFILLADESMADAIHNVGTEDVGFVLRALGAVSRFTSKMFTAFSPAFIAVNAIRDFMTAMLHGYQVGGVDYSMAIAKNIPRAVAELVRDAREGNGQLVKLYEQSGGRTGMVYMIKDFEEKHNEVMRQMAALQGVSLKEIQQAFAAGAKEGFKAIGRKARYNKFTGVFDSFVEAVEAVNGIVENTTRLAAFKAAMDAGKPAREAGSIAKNLTVNFNRKGELAPHLGSLYIFFNASVQGTVRMGEALRDRRLQVVAAGMFMASALIAALQMDDDDDEDGRADFEQIPAWQRSRNLIIRGDGGDYYKIPLPLGWNVFHMLGTEAAVMLKSKSKEAYAEGAGNMLKQAVGAFNPVGDFTPSVAAPFLQIARNESAFGGPIFPDYKKDQPDSRQFYDSTEGSAYERVTTWANDATGGNEFRAGLVDINPEKLEHVTEFFGGGALRFLTDTVDAVSAAVDGGPAQPADKLPIVRAFYGKLRDEYQTSRYYENKDKVSAVERELKGLQESGRYDEAAKLMAEKPWVFGLSAMADGMDKQSKSIRELERLIRADDSLSDGERRARLQELRVLKGQAMKPFNAAYEESVRK